MIYKEPENAEMPPSFLPQIQIRHPASQQDAKTETLPLA